MPAVPKHNTAVVDGSWDGSAQEAKLSTPIDAKGKKMYAWYDGNAAADPNGDGYPDAKNAWKFPHHVVDLAGTPGAANLNGVRNALARLPQASIPAGDMDAVKAHLQNHLDAQANSADDSDAEDRQSHAELVKQAFAIAHTKYPNGIPQSVTQAIFKDPQAWIDKNKGQGAASAELMLPRDNLFRAIHPGVELRDASSDAPVMNGHFSVFNQWTEINSLFEGQFMERFSPGAFKKTFAENRDGMRVLFQHGHDPVLGDKPLGPIDALREDQLGAYYEVPLLEASYVRDNVLPGLRAGLYGASFRFRVTREEVVEEPARSDYNPEGLPERTVKEAQVREFGPVTFPAYDGATAGVRSLTDEFLGTEAIRELIAREVEGATNREDTPAPPRDSAGTRHPDHGRRGKSKSTHLYGLGRGKEKEPWRL